MIIWYIINVEFTKVKRITHYKICIRFFDILLLHNASKGFAKPLNQEKHIDGGEHKVAKNIAIKVARAEKDMTQKVLAEAVGVSRQTINAIEKGEYNPTIKLCRKICRVLDKSLDDLFWEDEEDEN